MYIAYDNRFDVSVGTGKRRRLGNYAGDIYGYHLILVKNYIMILI